MGNARVTDFLDLVLLLGWDRVGCDTYEAFDGSIRRVRWVFRRRRLMFCWFSCVSFEMGGWRVIRLGHRALMSDVRLKFRLIDMVASRMFASWYWSSSSEEIFWRVGNGL